MISRPLAIRLVVLGVLAVVVQVAAVSQVEVLGVRADLTPLIVVSVGLLLGSVAGAVMGFSMGLLVDLALLQTLGVSSLVYVGVGYAAGRVREARDVGNLLVPLAAGAAGTAVALIGFAMIQFLLGVDAPVSFLLIREIATTIVINALLALPVFALVRRALGVPAADDRPKRSRRQRPPRSGGSGGRGSRRGRQRRVRTTGGLSPLRRP